MHGDGVRRLTIELDDATEPIRGRIGGEGRRDREFVGWLELAAALGQAIEVPSGVGARLRALRPAPQHRGAAG